MGLADALEKQAWKPVERLPKYEILTEPRRRPERVKEQIAPKQLGELMGDPDPEKSGRVMQAMLKMKKIVLADLQRAFDEA